MSRRGFTLLEMMLVIFVLGLSAGSVMFLFPAKSVSSPQGEATRFYLFIKQARDTAAMRGQTIGVKVMPQSYLLMQRTNGTWVPVDNNHSVSSGVVPEGITASLELGGYQWGSEYKSELQRRRLNMSQMELELQQNTERFKAAPQIWLSVFEPIIPFVLTFTEQTTQKCWTVSMDVSGELSSLSC